MMIHFISTQQLKCNERDDCTMMSPKSYLPFCLIACFNLMVFNATFNNISVISWRSVLLLVETGVPGENHRSVANHWHIWSHMMLYRVHLACSYIFKNGGTSWQAPCMEQDDLHFRIIRSTYSFLWEYLLFDHFLFYFIDNLRFTGVVLVLAPCKLFMSEFFPRKLNLVRVPYNWNCDNLFHYQYVPGNSNSYHSNKKNCSKHDCDLLWLLIHTDVYNFRFSGLCDRLCRFRLAI
jgi:hypothetical protein